MKSLPGVGLFRNANTNFSERKKVEELVDENSLITKRKIPQTENKTTGKKFKLPSDTNDFHHGGF